MGCVLLVRHGETTWNRDRRIQGWASTNLNDRGRDQVAALRDTITDQYDIHRIVASDLRRTRETVEPIASIVEPDVEFDKRWRERNFGACQGLTYEEFTAHYPHLSVAKAGHEAIDAKPEDGETLREMYNRIVAAWEDVTAKTMVGETSLVVTHGGPIALLLGHLKGLGPAESLNEHRQANCAINEITVPDFEIRRENDTSR